MEDSASPKPPDPDAFPHPPPPHPSKPLLPSTRLPALSTGSGKDEFEDEELTQLAEYYARTLISPPPPAAAAPSSSLLSAPVSAGREREKGEGRGAGQAGSRGVAGRSSLRASAPPFTASGSPLQSRARVANDRTPSEWPAVEWGGGKADRRGSLQPPSVDYSAPAFVHPFVSSPPSSFPSHFNRGHRASTPMIASSLSPSSVPFVPSTPSSAPAASRSLRDTSQQRLLPYPPFPTSSTYSRELISIAPGLPPLPSLPFDVPSDLDLLRERPEHASYMFSFRTSVCPLYLTSSCPHDAYTCFLAHSKTPRRRKPLLQHGRFNYIPTRCRYLLEERDCPKGLQCRFAHVTEEVIYHPSKYKTQLCSHAVDSDGSCTGYGRHCAKAHGEADRRMAVFEVEEGQGRRWTMDQLHEFACPADEREQGRSINFCVSHAAQLQYLPSMHRPSSLLPVLPLCTLSVYPSFAERLFYQFVYKTRRCAGYPWNCQCDGLDWHREEERRRGPAIRYAPMACPNVKPYLNAEWGDPNVDCSGRFAQVNAEAGRVVEWDCEYAHTLLELMYHPQVYKTSLCVGEGTLVTLGCGAALEVERVKAGDMVMAFDEEVGGVRRTEVLKAIEREEARECVELQLEDGRTLRCTPDHRLLTEGGDWLEAQQLLIGESRVRVSVEAPLLFAADLHRDVVARSFSCTLGDGARPLRFSCQDESSSAQLCALARLQGFLSSAPLQTMESEPQISVGTQLDAERVAADVDLVTGRRASITETPAGYAVRVPSQLRTLTISVPGFSSASYLWATDVPDDVFKECVAGFLGNASEVRRTSDEAPGKGGGLSVEFVFSASTSAACAAVGTQLLRQMELRDFPRVRCSLALSSDGGSQWVVVVEDARQWQRRVGLRYRSTLELQLAALVSRALIGAAVVTRVADDLRLSLEAALDKQTSTAPPSSSLPCYLLLLTGRRSAGAMRVYDLQVSPSLHSFVAAGVVVHNCDHFDEHHTATWKCVWKRRCAHAHGRDDLKHKEQAAEEWKAHLAVIGPSSTQKRPAAHLPSTLQPAVQQRQLKSKGSERVRESRSTAPPPSLEPHHRPEPHRTRHGFRHRTEVSYGRGAAQEPGQHPLHHPQSSPTVSSRWLGNADSLYAMSVMYWVRAGAMVSSSMSSASPLAAPSSWSMSLPSSDTASSHPSPPTRQTPPRRRLSLFDLNATSSSSSLWTSPSPSMLSSAVFSSSTDHPVPLVMSEEVLARLAAPFTSSPTLSAASTDSPWPDSTSSPLYHHSFPSAATSPLLQSLAPADSSDPDNPPESPPSPIHLSSHLLQSATSVLTTTTTSSSSDSGLVAVTSDERLSYDPQQLLSIGRDGVRTYAGVSSVHGHCAIRLIEADPAHLPQLVRQARQLLSLSQRGLLPHFIRHLDVEVDEADAQLAIALEMHPDALPLHEALPHLLRLSPTHPTHPTTAMQPIISLLHQLLTAVSSLHLQGVSHGDLSLRSVFVDPTFQHLNVADVVRSRGLRSDGLSADLYDVGCIGYWLLSSGRTPFRNDVQMEQWHEAALASPLDTSPFHPTAAHLITHLILTPHPNRMSAPGALRHPLFWSSARSIRFLISVSQLISSADDMGGHSRVADQQVRSFCAELDELAPFIFPAPAVSPFGPAVRPEWGSSVHSGLHQCHPMDVQERQSVVSLLHFIAASLRHLLHAPLLSCLIHALFHLDHRHNCARPRPRRAQQHHPNTASPHRRAGGGVGAALDPDAVVSYDSDEEAVSAVGVYFAQRFPPLVISVFHLAQRRWAEHATLRAFFGQAGERRGQRGEGDRGLGQQRW